MEFDPGSGKLKCAYCGTAAAVPEASKPSLRELPFSEYEHASAGQISEQALQVTCAGCGVTVQFEPPEVAGACPFCAAPIVAQPKAADPLVAPHGVLPFHVSREAGNQAVRAWLRGLWFAPDGLKKLAQTEALQGVYLPYWTFDANTRSDYRGERGTHHWETEVYTSVENGRQVQRTRQVMRTRWDPAWGTVSVSFDDVLVPATRAVSMQRLGRLDPWGPEPVRPYEPGFLAGFKAQRYQIGLPQGYEIAKGVMKNQIEDQCRRDIGGDEQRVQSVETEYRDVTFKHILLPVWIGAYRFQGKVYQVLVNGGTAEVQGGRPYSVWKILAAVLIGLVVVLILALLSQRS